MRALITATLFAATVLAGASLVPSVISPAVAAEETRLAPAPAVDEAAGSATAATAYFAGGCFWGVEGVFSHVKGVRSVVSGYGGGPAKLNVDYDRVGSGRTGYAESVRVIYDPSQVSYGTLLRIFFSVITDPTTLNYQGPDHGTQYRSALFPQSADQERVAKAYLAQLGKSGLWKDPIVTKIEPVGRFQPAEDYHQDFMRLNPNHGYIRMWDAPKLAAFQKLFPTLYKAGWSA
ncbi:peptide-methionine (S)-S-oxide reductase MsrA [Sphingobium nicotianae]|uniref:Peptide methionine sulfoxide reductase MsrA n=1 Tax=Sphingobium nicotianae TaxID=2782607 RepID=A0A9X1ISI1_9SPHN|nr:peptide-methionine (S)-S-oxide reductase MsrA [Sphingobium nicotianae]MBT2188503.1 peptide-methionine (S)-S-oxide reductase MsrA [Sphingobium nicotianae]